MGLGIFIISSTYTPYSIYLRGTIVIDLLLKRIVGSGFVGLPRLFCGGASLLVSRAHSNNPSIAARACSR